ncbi:hypothetical protein LTR53_008046 [Teratosphaeriaceae sp. CCFEE 6253]|nr:hypothetical protein LTR53_008046 [Teratosphaeriaceae sp. CCFEE 6253]
MSYTACYTPPRPSRLRDCMVAENDDLHHDDAAQYLSDLRTHKSSRPSGSRPPPPSKFASLRRTETAPPELQTNDDRPPLPSSNSMPIMPAQRPTHRRTESALPTSTPMPPRPHLSHRRAESDLRAKSPFAGRPLVRPPPVALQTSAPPALDVRPGMVRPVSMGYMESGTRWMENQEAKSLRMALEDMDLEEETHIHTAARDEAAELVWKHQNPAAAAAVAEAPYSNPEVKSSRDYRSHLRRGSYQRSIGQELVPIAEARKTSGGNQPASMDVSVAKRGSVESSRKVSPPAATMPVRKSRTPSERSYGGLAEAVDLDIAKAFRRTSGGSRRIMSGEKKAYMHHNDRIYEDPEDAFTLPKTLEEIPEPTVEPVKPAITPIQPSLARVRNNPFARVRLQQHAKLEHSVSAPVLPVAKHDSVEIQRNTPPQDKKAWYMSNEPLPPTPPSSRDHVGDDVEPKSTPTKDGKEIRSDDIRSATSKQRKDRSPNLPSPTMVSDKPGRPIVSFKQDWRPKEVVLEEVHTAAAPAPSRVNRVAGTSRSAPHSLPSTIMPEIQVHEVSKPPIPTIVLPDDYAVPSIVLPEEPDFATSSSLYSAPTTPGIKIEPPTFSFSGPDDDSPAPAKKATTPRPLPTPTRPTPHHAATTGALPMAQTHRTPYARPSGILCAHCALPIAGRILSAAGERFHPACFVCNECGTNLEHVAFYPEPDKAFAERRAAGDESSDPSQRFYCHLDFHEHFSPRCKSCKTPIEGEVIVACSAEWHAGHFFCAQCGDPFDAHTPFVEKEGYAWCVGCHTNRFSGKCRGCRKPVTDVVVKALGADWHESCFVCQECKGDFGDGRYFLRGESQEPVCVKCEERRLKA